LNIYAENILLFLFSKKIIFQNKKKKKRKQINDTVKEKQKGNGISPEG